MPGAKTKPQDCRWCRVVESGDHVVQDEPAFVVMEGSSRRRGAYLVLVTKAHVNVITRLPVSEMGAVLAGLTRASDALAQISGPVRINVYAHPVGRRGGRGHLHFRLVPELFADGKVSAEQGSGPSAFASLVETISH
jgi:diadenosine tetraphosphate (Ap4A) HIT family hydrolase